MGFVKSIRTSIRKRIGLWPAREIWNSVVLGPRLPALIRFESREVMRLRSGLGRIPEAKIACIIPTFKRPQGLLKAIDSVLAQERQDFVIVVVDDGAGLPQLPADPRIFAVSLSRNSAVLGIVRNVGIRLSRSEYVAFLDDDNVWTPRHLSVAIDSLEKGADLAYTAVRRTRPDGSELDVLSKPFDRKRFSDETSWVDANSIVLRRAFCPLFSRLPRTRATLPKEDWEFVWRASRRAKVVHVPEVTVEYLVNPGSYYTSWKPHATGLRDSA
jgi:GT2 family glycosyltransferase